MRTHIDNQTSISNEEFRCELMIAFDQWLARSEMVPQTAIHMDNCERYGINIPDEE